MILVELFEFINLKRGVGVRAEAWDLVRRNGKRGEVLVEWREGRRGSGLKTESDLFERGLFFVLILAIYSALFKFSIKIYVIAANLGCVFLRSRRKIKRGCFHSSCYSNEV